jgi:hypothetical protein
MFEHIEHCYPIIRSVLNFWGKLIDGRLENRRRTPFCCQSGKPLIWFNAFETSIRRVNFEKAVAGTDTNFQNSRPLRPFKLGKQIPEYYPACAKPPVLPFEQCIVLGVALFHQAIILSAAAIPRSTQLTGMMTLR